MMFCPVQRVEDVKNDPQAIINNYVEPMVYRGLGRVGLPGYPVHFSECSAGTRGPALFIGENTDEILGEAGYTDQEIAELRR